MSGPKQPMIYTYKTSAASPSDISKASGTSRKPRQNIVTRYSRHELSNLIHKMENLDINRHLPEVLKYTNKGAYSVLEPQPRSQIKSDKKSSNWFKPMCQWESENAMKLWKVLWGLSEVKEYPDINSFAQEWNKAHKYWVKNLRLPATQRKEIIEWWRQNEWELLECMTVFDKDDMLEFGKILRRLLIFHTESHNP